MARHLKYLTGSRIETMQEFADEIAAGRYVIMWWGADPTQQKGLRLHPEFISGWPFRLVQAHLNAGRLYRAIPNPEARDA